MTHWTKGVHASNTRNAGSKRQRKAAATRVRNPKSPRSFEDSERDDVPDSGPLNGYDASLLLKRYGTAAADVICERVAREGGR